MPYAIAGGLALAALVIAFSPALRGKASGLLSQTADAARSEFAATPNIDDYVAVLVDLSADSVADRAVIANQVFKVWQAYSQPPILVLTRYAHREERIGQLGGVQLRNALKTDYVDAPIPSRPNTNLAHALAAVNRDFEVYKKQNPKARLTIIVASAGGVEDAAETRKVAEKMASQGAVCVLLGSKAKLINDPAKGRALQGRLHEQHLAALRPFTDHQALFTITQAEFPSKLAPTIQALQALN